MVALTGGSSKQNAQFRRLAAQLPDVLARSPAPTPRKPRQRQRRLTPEQVQQLVAEYQAGHDMKALAERRDVHRQTVAAHMRHADVQLRPQRLTESEIAEAARLYALG